MGRQEPSAEEMLETARRNNYKPGAHKELDGKRNQGKHGKKTIKDQDRTLGRYVAWYLGVMKQEYAHADLPPPTEQMARAECLRVGAPAPSLENVKDFMRFNVSINRAVIAEKPTVDSMNAVAEWFPTDFTRVTVKKKAFEPKRKQLVSERENEDMKQHFSRKEEDEKHTAVLAGRPRENERIRKTRKVEDSEIYHDEGLLEDEIVSTFSSFSETERIAT